MFDYSRMLVAYDGSDSSRNALRQAVRLAGQFRASVAVMTSMPSADVDVEFEGTGSLWDLFKVEAGRLIDEAREIARGQGVEVSVHIEQGEIYETIIQKAREIDAGLVVLGRRGLSRLERMLMGSVTARVISRIDRDVLVVPRDAELGWDKILVASDGSSYSNAAVERAIEFAAAHSSELSIVSVVEMNGEFYAFAPDFVKKLHHQAQAVVDEVCRKAMAKSVSCSPKVREGMAYKEIEAHAEAEQVGALFIGSHGRTGLVRFLMGSVAEKIIGHVSAPVFIIHRKP